MQDNEFDAYFKANFIGAELDAPADMWAKIENGLPQKNQRNFRLLGMVATLAIAVCAGLLLLQKNHKIKLHGKENTTSSQVATDVGRKIKSTKPAVDKPLGVSEGKGNAVVYKHNENQLVKNKSPKKIPAVQPSRANLHLPNKSVLAMQKSDTINNITVKRVALAMAAPDKNRPVLEIGNDAQTSVKTEKRNIDGIGDLVNYVVDKVDKRENKFIRFYSDGEGTSLVSVNIGILKWNGKKMQNRYLGDKN